MRPGIRQVESDLPDPWADKHSMKSRVGRDEAGLLYVWIWTVPHIGWAYAGSEENAIKLLAMEPGSRG